MTKKLIVILVVVFALVAINHSSVAQIRPTLENETTVDSSGTMDEKTVETKKVETKTTTTTTPKYTYNNVVKSDTRKKTNGNYVMNNEVTAVANYSMGGSTDNLDYDWGGLDVSLSQSSSPNDPYWGVHASFGAFGYDYQIPLYNISGTGYKSIGQGKIFTLGALWNYRSTDFAFNTTQLEVNIKKTDLNSNDNHGSSVEEKYVSLVLNAYFDFRSLEGYAFNWWQFRASYNYPLIEKSTVTQSNGKKINGTVVTPKESQFEVEFAVLSFPVLDNMALVLTGIGAYRHLTNGLTVGLDKGVKDLFGLGGGFYIHYKNNPIFWINYKEHYNKPTGNNGNGDKYIKNLSVNLDVVGVAKVFISKFGRKR